MYLFLSKLNYLATTVVNPSGSTPVTESAGQAVAGATELAPASPLSSSFLLTMVIYVIVIFVFVYFTSTRPQKKKAEEIAKMRETIKTGDSVLLSNGMFGKIVDTTAECYVIEFGMNKGIKIPVLKKQVLEIREPNLTNKPEEPKDVKDTEKKGDDKSEN